MKKSMLLVAALAAVGFTGSAFAYTAKDSADKVAAPVIKLVPSKVVALTSLPLEFSRQVVNVEFTLNEKGQPQDIKVLSSDRALKKQVVAAFSQWEFDVTGRDTSKRFVLPLDIIPQA